MLSAFMAGTDAAVARQLGIALRVHRGDDPACDYIKIKGRGSVRLKSPTH